MWGSFPGKEIVMASQKFIRNNYDSVPAYEPPGHSGTVNHRLIGPSYGSEHLEIIIGEMTPSGGAEPHKHDEFEQSMFVLEGKLHIWTDESDGIFGPGDCVLFPVGCVHTVDALEYSKFLVIYGPPKEKV